MANTKKAMSKIHWSLRKKGYGLKSAYKKTRQIKGLAWKFKRKHAYRDYDGDGVVNKYDCQPRNKWKQDRDAYSLGDDDVGMPGYDVKVLKKFKRKKKDGQISYLTQDKKTGEIEEKLPNELGWERY